MVEFQAAQQSTESERNAGLAGRLFWAPQSVSWSARRRASLAWDPHPGSAPPGSSQVSQLFPVPIFWAHIVPTEFFPPDFQGPMLGRPSSPMGRWEPAQTNILTPKRWGGCASEATCLEKRVLCVFSDPRWMFKMFHTPRRKPLANWVNFLPIASRATSWLHGKFSNLML